jgi:hypothetical protein
MDVKSALRRPLCPTAGGRQLCEKMALNFEVQSPRHRMCMLR